jgi:hypothetical protein
MKIARLLALSITVVVIFALGMHITFSSPQQQDTLEIAAPPVGLTGFEFVAQIDQNNLDLNIYGYITHVGGLNANALFVDGTSPIERSEATAYLTMQATGEIYARSVLESIFSTSARSLSLLIFYNETPSASFDDPASFSTGTHIATYSLRLQNILNVQSTDVGIVDSNGDTVQTHSASFTLGENTLQFGHLGVSSQIEAFGQGFRASEEPLVVRLLIAGHTTVINLGE